MHLLDATLAIWGEDICSHLTYTFEQWTEVMYYIVNYIY